MTCPRRRRSWRTRPLVHEDGEISGGKLDNTTVAVVTGINAPVLQGCHDPGLTRSDRPVVNQVTKDHGSV
jgi:hypothetical protein